MNPVHTHHSNVSHPNLQVVLPSGATSIQQAGKGATRCGEEGGNFSSEIWDHDSSGYFFSILQLFKILPCGFTQFCKNNDLNMSSLLGKSFFFKTYQPEVCCINTCNSQVQVPAYHPKPSWWGKRGV